MAQSITPVITASTSSGNGDASLIRNLNVVFVVTVVFVVVALLVTHRVSPVNVLTDTLRPSVVSVISPSRSVR
jgi:hypothetical protein